MIENLLQGKTQAEKVKIKAKEIAKFNHVGKFSKNNLEIEILSLSEIEGGVELFAKAWKNGKQLGFGKDGSVEIERFRIINPPVLVDDPNGSIIRNWNDSITGELKTRKLKEDPVEAIRQSLAHTVSLVGKDGSNVVKGKIGNTTSTFYPDADAESTSVDGLTRNTTSGETWTNKQSGSGVDAFDALTADGTTQINSGGSSNTWDELRRGIFLFDTSSLPDSDSVSSATLSLASGGSPTKSDGLNITPDITVVSSNPASNTALVAADHTTLGTTEFSSRITYASWSSTAGTYNDFSLNASGIANISKTGVSKFGTRNGNYDLDNVAPTWSTSTFSVLRNYFADQTGTANDPKLVVEHAAASSIKTRNGIARANIKTINGIAIASVKTVNGIA